MKKIFRDLLISVIIVMITDMIAIQSLTTLQHMYSWMGDSLIYLTNYHIRKTIVESLPSIPAWFVVIESIRYIINYVKAHYDEWVSEFEEEEA